MVGPKSSLRYPAQLPALYEHTRGWLEIRAERVKSYYKIPLRSSMLMLAML